MALTELVDQPERRPQQGRDLLRRAACHGQPAASFRPVGGEPTDHRVTAGPKRPRRLLGVAKGAPCIGEEVGFSRDTCKNAPQNLIS